MHTLDSSNSDAVEKTRLAYENLAPSYAAIWFDDPIMEPELNHFLNMVQLPGEVLDAGCGPGRDVLAFANRGVEAIGVDLSSSMIAEAKSRVPNSIFRRMDLRDLKYPRDTFVGVWACASIHHLPEKDVAQAMREFARVLKPGGILSITVEEGEGEYFDRAGRYRRLYTLSDFRQLIVQSGFEILEERLSQRVKGTLKRNKAKTWLHAFARKTNDAPEEDSSEYDCPFCWESRFQLCRKIGIPATGSILWGDDDVYVFPAVAPLLEGHLLIASTSHHICFGACPNNMEPVLVATQRRVRQLMQEAYQQPALFFEHGPARSRMAGACIDHAHLHCLPLSLPVKQIVSQHIGAGQRASFNTLRSLNQAGYSYLYVEDDPERGWVYPVEVVPSQFLRQVVAKLLGHQDWRWQDSCSAPGSVNTYRNTLERLLPLADRLWL